MLLAELPSAISNPSPSSRLVPPDTPPDTADNLQRLFRENGWTDGLPVILPKKARVAEMPKGTSHKPAISDDGIGAGSAEIQ